MSEGHPFHKTIRNMIRENGLDEEYEIREDPACVIESRFHGKKKMLPLYRKFDSDLLGHKDSHPIDVCWVDMIIKKRDDNRVPIVIEIDESGTSPHHICGKFLTTAMAEYYDDGVTQYPLLPNTLFIQVVKIKASEDSKSQMIRKWMALENFIQANIQFKDSKKARYMLFWNFDDKLRNQNEYDFIESIRSHMKSI